MFSFPKADKLGYLMINRASVQLWGKAGQTAGPPKSAGKKSDTRIPLPDPIADPGARIRFYLHKEFRAAGIRFYLHKESARPGSDFIYTNLHILKKFPAARAT